MNVLMGTLNPIHSVIRSYSSAASSKLRTLYYTVLFSSRVPHSINVY